MINWLFFLVLFSFGCKKGEPQRIEISNKSLQNIYYFVSKNSVLLPNQIQIIRPKSIKSFLEQEKKFIHVKNTEDSLARAKNYIYSFRIEANTSMTIISSESAGTSVNSISLKEVIKRQYNGQANVFLIKESYLNQYSNAEIIKKKLYKRFLTIEDKDISKNVMVFDYK